MMYFLLCGLSVESECPAPSKLFRRKAGRKEAALGVPYLGIRRSTEETKLTLLSLSSVTHSSPQSAEQQKSHSRSASGASTRGCLLFSLLPTPLHLAQFPLSELSNMCFEVKCESCGKRTW